MRNVVIGNWVTIDETIFGSKTQCCEWHVTTARFENLEFERNFFPWPSIKIGKQNLLTTDHWYDEKMSLFWVIRVNEVKIACDRHKAGFFSPTRRFNHILLGHRFTNTLISLINSRVSDTWLANTYVHKSITIHTEQKWDWRQTRQSSVLSQTTSLTLTFYKNMFYYKQACFHKT